MSRRRGGYDTDSEEDETTGLLSGGKDQEEQGSSDDADLLAQTDSDSDDAPEDVGSSASRQVVMQKVKDTLKQIQQGKQSQKEKRKKRDDLFKKQKEERLSTLAKSRLPDDFLDDLSSEPIIKKRKTPEKVKDIEGDQTKDTEVKDNDSEGQTSDESVHSEDDEEDDFLPLSSNEDAALQAVALNDFLKQPKTSQEKAQEFLQTQMYGARVHRESVQAYKGKLAKRKARVR